MNRGEFLRRSVRQLAAASLAMGSGALRGQSRPSITRPELRISRIVIQEARGRRLTPVAPNAYAPYRGFDAREPVLRIQTAQGLEGIAHNPINPQLLKPLLGLDPFTMFEWNGEMVLGAAEPHRKLLSNLQGADVALFDLLGKAMKRPIAN